MPYALSVPCGFGADSISGLQGVRPGVPHGFGTIRGAQQISGTSALRPLLGTRPAASAWTRRVAKREQQNS